MATTIATGLMGITPAAWLAGMEVDPSGLQDLVQQSNAMVAAASSPWFTGWIRGDDGESATLELPPAAGIRVLSGGWGSVTIESANLTLNVADDSGALGSFAPPADCKGWADFEFSRKSDGWITIEAVWDGGIGATAAMLALAPGIGLTDFTDTQSEHYIPDSRVAANAGITIGLMNELSAAVWQVWRRPLIYWTWLDPTGYLRPDAGGYSVIVASIPIRGRGRKLGISVQAAGSATARVRVAVGDCSAEATDFPGAKGTIKRAQSTATLPFGYFLADVRAYVPAAGSLRVYSISVYEVP